jgi:hypothetical protein
MSMRKTGVLLILIVVAAAGHAQDSTSSRLNTIKLNLVSSLLYSNSVALSYERMVKPTQSWAVMAGYVQFPQFGTMSSFTVRDEDSNAGFVVGGEYRFYLKKENKYAAPHGIYVGPFANYFEFSNGRSLTYTTPAGTLLEGKLNSKIDVVNIGFQVGYQFVFKDRWTIDMIFIGPSLSSYSLKMKLDGNFGLTEEDILEHELLAALTDRFPLIKDLISKETVDVNGTKSKWGGGFRYQLNVGYRFGRKVKH